MRFGGSLSIEFWIEIHVCVRMVLVLLKVPVDDIDWGDNHVHR